MGKRWKGAWSFLRKYVPIVALNFYLAARFLYRETRILNEWIDQSVGDSRGGRLMGLGLKMLGPTGLLVFITGLIKFYDYDAVALHGVAWILVFLGLVLFLEET